MRHTRVAPLAALAALSLASLALAGCGPSGSASPSATPSAATPITPSMTPGPSATPSPTTTASGTLPSLGSLVITTSGLGPLAIGRPISGNPGEAMLAWNAAICDPVLNDPSDLGRWISTYPEGGFSVDARAEGVMHRIDIWSSAISTPEGVHLGTPIADLLATYPGLTVGTAGFDSVKVRWMGDAHGYVVFETSSELGDGTSVPEQVRFIRILDATSDPNFTISNSDNIAGNCL